MRIPKHPLTPVAAVAAFALLGCSGGSGETGFKVGGDFVVLKVEPPNNGKLFLNEPIRIDFSNNVDLSTANLNTVSFAVFDQAGKPLSEQPAGEFRLSRSPGDGAVGRRLEFVPRFPSNDTYDNGGFRPGRRYAVQLVGGNQRNDNVLRDSRGKSLTGAISFEFRTADGTTPSQLFRDTKPGGPRRVGFDVSPRDQSGVALSKSAQAPVQVTLKFDQPLDPNSANVPFRLTRDPAKRDLSQRGRVFIEYDDPDQRRGRNTWVPAAVDLAVNTLEGSEVVLTPLGVLPNNAICRVIVENTLQDMSGESNVRDASYDRIFGTFTTRAAYEPQFDAVVENFLESDFIDLDAPFLEPVAEIGPNFVKASFDFDGSATVLDYEPNTNEIVLNTDFTQITPKGAPPINVAGGVFSFRNVRIPAGVTVRGTGSRPMVWLVTEDFIVNGDLHVDGGLGTRVNTLNSANFPAGGGPGVCGGGNGGAGSPSSNNQSPEGQPGSGPGQVPGGGGKGGKIAAPQCGRGSGGGGGSFATQGDPYYKRDPGNNGSFQQVTGNGGLGCLGNSGQRTQVLPGGVPGAMAFTDARDDNNFWGRAVNVQRRIRIFGEMNDPQGGAGGGGGGDRTTAINTANWINDQKGGGGGGGAGVIIIKALGNIEIGAQGSIHANGGNGGGGEQAGGNTHGGGGGGGSGGMVVLMAGRKIRIEAKGETYANNNYEFPLRADGGLGIQGRYGGTEWNDKYPPPASGQQWDNNPAGAFGGLGVVQLMAPPGQADGDNTGTVLDENVDITRNGNPMTGAEKKRYLAWRGFPNEKGDWVDDNNDLTNIGKDEGEIRPTPILMPSPFGSKSRVFSRWISTGFSQRRPLTAPDGGPRGIVEDTQNGLLAGPTYHMAATAFGTKYDGYVAYRDNNAGGLEIAYPRITGKVDLRAIDTNQTYDGQPAYRLELNDPVLGSVVDRYVGYQADVFRQGELVGTFRILRQTDRVLFVDASRTLPVLEGQYQVQVLAKFFEMRVNNQEGLGPTYQENGKPVPVANVRFGFAFHKDPAHPSWKDPNKQIEDLNRFPNRVGSFIYDLADPSVQEQIRTFVGDPKQNAEAGAAFVKYDILFNTRFAPEAAANERGTALSASMPRPELRYLVLPFWF